MQRILIAKMLREFLIAKIHRATVTEAEINYIGSITIDPDLLEAVDMMNGEKVQVLSCDNGERLETYILLGKRGSGEICMNGPAALKIGIGHKIIIITYGMMTTEEATEFKPKIVFPDDNNELT